MGASSSVESFVGLKGWSREKAVASDGEKLLERLRLIAILK